MRSGGTDARRAWRSSGDSISDTRSSSAPESQQCPPLVRSATYNRKRIAQTPDSTRIVNCIDRSCAVCCEKGSSNQSSHSKMSSRKCSLMCETECRELAMTHTSIIDNFGPALSRIATIPRWQGRLSERGFFGRRFSAAKEDDRQQKQNEE